MDTMDTTNTMYTADAKDTMYTEDTKDTADTAGRDTRGVRDMMRASDRVDAAGTDDQTDPVRRADSAGRTDPAGLKYSKYIQTEQFESLLKDIIQKLLDGEISECEGMLRKILEETVSTGKCIDRTYIGCLNERKRSTRIADINRMLGEMSLLQIENVRKYTSDEYDEPNHEAEALEAIIKLSRKGRDCLK